MKLCKNITIAIETTEDTTRYGFFISENTVIPAKTLVKTSLSIAIREGCYGMQNIVQGRKTH